MANASSPGHDTGIERGLFAPEFVEGQNTIVPAERISVTNAKGGITYFDLDENGQVLRTTSPAPAGATEPIVATATYNANRQVTASKDPVSSATFSYASNGLLQSAATGTGLSWEWLWSGVDLLSYKDPSGVDQVTLEYNNPALPHFATSATDASGNTWSFAANSHGQVTTVTPPAGSPTLPSTVSFRPIVIQWISPKVSHSFSARVYHRCGRMRADALSFWLGLSTILECATSRKRDGPAHTTRRSDARQENPYHGCAKTSGATTRQ